MLIKNIIKVMNSSELIVKQNLSGDSLFLIKDDFNIQLSKEAVTQQDNTACEAFYNHIHITDSVHWYNFQALKCLGYFLINVMKKKIREKYPNNHFYLYLELSFDGGMIYRIHQKHPGESAYIDPEQFRSKRQVVYRVESP